MELLPECLIFRIQSYLTFRDVSNLTQTCKYLRNCIVDRGHIPHNELTLNSHNSSKSFLEIYDASFRKVRKLTMVEMVDPHLWLFGYYPPILNFVRCTFFNKPFLPNYTEVTYYMCEHKYKNIRNRGEKNRVFKHRVKKI